MCTDSSASIFAPGRVLKALLIKPVCSLAESCTTIERIYLVGAVFSVNSNICLSAFSYFYAWRVMTRSYSPPKISQFNSRIGNYAFCKVLCNIITLADVELTFQVEDR